MLVRRGSSVKVPISIKLLGSAILGAIATVLLYLWGKGTPDEKKTTFTITNPNIFDDTKLSYRIEDALRRASKYKQRK